MPTTRPRARFAWALGAVLAALPAARAGTAAPRDELLRFVPDNVGFCLVVQDLRGHAAALAASPFAEQLRRSPLWAALRNAAEVHQLNRVDQFLRKQLGVGWEQLRDDVLGDAVVFAFRPGPPGKPEQDRGLFLVRARSARVLAGVVDRLNAAQKDSGELKELAEREHKGVKYYRRTERKETNYYCLRGPVLIFSSQEEAVRSAIERNRAAADPEPRVSSRLRELGIDKAFVALWVNPRAFDPAVTARAEDPADAGAKAFAGIWKALDGLGLAVHLDRDLRLSLAVRARTAELPSSAKRFLAEASKPGELWRYFPEGALVALGARADLAALFELLSEFMNKPARDAVQADLNRTLGAVLGKNVVKEVLPAVGPDWGLCVTAPPEEKSWAPRVLFALRVAGGAGEDPVDRAVLSALHSWAVLAVLAHNGKHPERPLRIRTLVADRHEVRYLDGKEIFPPGVRPAFALKAGYLVLASSPELIRAFGSAPGPAPAGPVPLLRVSVKELRAYLKARREELAKALAEKEKTSKEQALTRIDSLRTNLEWLERLELHQRTSPGQVTFTLTVQPAKPLRK
jgi:hypothetical protein